MSQFKLSPLVKEEDLTAKGFVMSLGVFYGGFEEKRGVSLSLAIDFQTKLLWINVDNDNINFPETVWKKKYDLDEEEVEYAEADEVNKKYRFDLGFEIPQVFIEMLMNGQIVLEKGSE